MIRHVSKEVPAQESPTLQQRIDALLYSATARGRISPCSEIRIASLAAISNANRPDIIGIGIETAEQQGYPKLAETMREYLNFARSRPHNSATPPEE